MKVNKNVLDNGLTVLAVPAGSFESVTIAVGVHYGILDSEKGLGESAHFLEHMMWRGTRRRTTKMIRDEEREIGALTDAETDYESTVYFIRAHKECFERAMGLLSDMLKNSILPVRGFELERGAVINETLIHYDNPIFFARDYLAPFIFNEHLKNVPRPGDTAPARNQTRKGLLKIYKDMYTPKNMNVAVYGGVSSDHILRSVSKHFGDMEKRYVPVNRTIAVQRQEMKEKVLERQNAKQARIAIGFNSGEYKGGEKGIDEGLALRVATSILNGRLFEQIRDNRGLSYDQAAFRYAYGTFGFMAAEVGTELKNLELVKKLVLGEFRKLQDGEISRNDVERNRNSQRIEFALQREDTLGMADALATSQAVYGSTELLEKFEARIMEVGVDDVRRVCCKYIDADKYVCCILKPTDKK